MDIKEQEGLEIFLGYKCNIKCIFCYQKDLRFEYKDNIIPEKVISLIKNGKQEGKQFIIFSGGEPTLDPNLPKYIELSKELGYEHIRIHTNGWGFREYSYLEKLYGKGLTGITLSIHGYGEIQDILSQVPGNFSILKRALINFERLKRKDNTFIIDTNTVLCKKNYKHIPKLIKFLTYFSITRGQIVLTYSLGLFSDNEKKVIIPQYRNILPFLQQSIDIAQEKNKKFVLENIPFCVIHKKYWDSIMNNIKIDKDSITIKEGNIGNTNINWMGSSKKCKKCNMKNICRGLPEDYKNIYGDDCLTTIYD